MSRALAALALLALSACSVPHIDAYVPRQRNYDVVTPKSATAEADNSGGLWRPDAKNAALYSDYRAFREQDLVVVRVEEMADARRSADTRLNRDSEMTLALQAFLRAAGTTVNAGPQLDGTVSAKTGSDFNADGRTGRTERLTATVPAIVKKVLPNGNLFIEGHRVVLVNSEEQHFYISGVVRPIDITQDNSVRSSYVADAEIEFTGRGVLSDNQKPGLLTRFFNWIWPL
ncbi:MAG: flagellar basal body L-ring protein FlgH [Myxococcus sp.]|nr:flagellar basal body L-ring protein FlgH [Myxococcus sp.]